MYAVVTTGGKQYRVEPGITLVVERLSMAPGESVTFDRVLLVSDGSDLKVGTPTVAGATVSGTILGEERGPKLVIFKFKQKVKYRRRTGHRQHLTRVRIDAINADGKAMSSATADAAPTRKAPAKKPSTTTADAAPAQKAPARKAPARKAPANKAAEE